MAGLSGRTKTARPWMRFTGSRIGYSIVKGEISYEAKFKIIQSGLTLV